MGGTYVLDGQPKTVEEAVDRAQFFQHARQGRQPKTRRDVVRIVAPWEAPSRDIQDLQNRIKELERALQDQPPVQPNPPPPLEFFHPPGSQGLCP